MGNGGEGPSDISAYPRLQRALSGAAPVPAELMVEYPRILARIDELWGSADCEHYLDEMLFSGRSGRQGFGDSLLFELLQLKGLHRDLYPGIGGSPFDPFASLPVSDVDLVLTRSPAVADRVASPPSGADGDPPIHGDAAALSPGLPNPAGAWPMVRSIARLRECLSAALYGKGLRDARRLGEILVSVGAAPPEAIEKALECQRRQAARGSRPDSLGQLLTDARVIKPQDLVWGLCVQQGIPIVDLASVRPASEVFRKLPPQLMRDRSVAPVVACGNLLAVAAANPLCTEGLEYVGLASGMVVRTVAADAIRLAKLIEGVGLAASTSKQLEDEFKAWATGAPETFTGDSAVDAPEAEAPADSMSENDATVIGLVNKFINGAIELGASDIHLEGAAGEDSHLRIRRDGEMENYSDFSPSYHRAVVSRIKIMSDLDISERRRPQDGKISFRTTSGRRVDLRVAVIPTLRGIENVTIRILHAGEPLPLEQIGMAATVLEHFRREMFKPYGLILVCGPTGSGKTTTLHSALRELNTPKRKIWTAEDPVEIVQRNINQVQVNPKIGCDFAHVLRAFLRADPDVIMIGEMRDQETAKIAVEASMTGHLVLSTVHTNSAAETVARLLDLGVDPFSFSDALLAILGQRLSRRLCPDCVRYETASMAELRDLAVEYHTSANPKHPANDERERIIGRWRAELGDRGELRLGRAVGCEACRGTGYRGRIGLHELLVASPEIRHLVRARADAHEIQAVGIKQGLRTLKQDGIDKVLRGLTDMLQVRATCI